jgi:hypothetical protein
MYKLVLEIDYAVENGAGGTNNCSSQFKNLEKLVKILDAQLVSKLDGCSSSNSSSLETREGSRSNTTIDAIGNPLYLPTCPIYIYIYILGGCLLLALWWNVPPQPGLILELELME